MASGLKENAALCQENLELKAMVDECLVTLAEMQARLRWGEVAQERLLQKEVILQAENEYLEKRMMMATRNQERACDELRRQNECLKLQVNGQKIVSLQLRESRDAAESDSGRWSILAAALQLQLQKEEKARQVAEDNCQLARTELSKICRQHEAVLSATRAETAELAAALEKARSDSTALLTSADKNFQKQLKEAQAALKKEQVEATEVARLKQELAESKEAVARLQLEQEKYIGQDMCLQHEKAEADERCRELERTVRGMARGLEAAREEKARLKQELETALRIEAGREKEGQQAGAAGEADLERRVQELEDSLSSELAAREATQKELQKAKQDLTKIRDEITVKDRMARVVEREKDRLERALKAAETERKGALAKVKELQTEVSDLRLLCDQSGTKAPTKLLSRKPKETPTRNLDGEMAAAAADKRHTLAQPLSKDKDGEPKSMSSNPGEKEAPHSDDPYSELIQTGASNKQQEKGVDTKVKAAAAKPARLPPAGKSARLGIAPDSQNRRTPLLLLSPNRGMSPQRDPYPSSMRKQAQSGSQDSAPSGAAPDTASSRKRRLAPLVPTLLRPEARASGGPSAFQGAFKVPKLNASGAPTAQ